MDYLFGVGREGVVGEQPLAPGQALFLLIFFHVLFFLFFLVLSLVLNSLRPLDDPLSLGGVELAEPLVLQPWSRALHEPVTQVLLGHAAAVAEGRALAAGTVLLLLGQVGGVTAGHRRLDPVQVVPDADVDAGLLGLGATHAMGHDAAEEILGLVLGAPLAEQGAAAVTCIT